jgi:hypothetical protein
MSLTDSGSDVSCLAEPEVVEQELALFDADQNCAGVEEQRSVVVDDRPVERRADRHGVEAQRGRRCPNG